MGNKTSAIFHLHEQLTASTDLTENHPAFTQGGPFPPFRKVDALAAALPKHTFAINGPRWTYSDKDMIVKSLIIFSNMAGCLLPGSGQAGELHASLQSPDGRLSWMLHADNRTAHSLKKGNRTVLEPSGLGIVVNGKDLAGGITGWSVKKVKDNVRDTFETRGKYPSASVHFNEYVVSGDNSGLRLRARVFNNGVAFRYEWTEDM